ncbi:MAG: DNA repair protein RecN [Hydrotalea flava]|nr:DNA repair protein RecN [Hydrotalea flava]NIM38110.1 DNA repair protein RecN [Hydrotalea flava]NIN03273.1 DNA repair protein RecN [Hydrotalea flava]NIN14968.1 DNA repair protein RecN [Hydrotalea flava]NIO94036.1 DNA repair protein RecN [Hydrotalea flava]
MLQKLYIQNYVIIDEVSIQFSHKLNIITGETGAGKSILMGALNLILGERADTAVLINPEKKCIIEGVFLTENRKAVTQFLKENELDLESSLLIRREIAPNGKSRAFINDTPVSLQQLKTLGNLLVDLHQQFDTLDLAKADFQRQVIDALAQQSEPLKKYQFIYKQWKDTLQELASLQSQKTTFEKEADYNRFLLDELTTLQLAPNELENLDQELKLLSNSEGIKATLTGIVYPLIESEQPIVQQLKQIIQQLQGYHAMHPDIPALIERLNAAHIELKDIATEIDHINQHILFDAERIAEIEERLAAGYKLLKKHNVQNTEALLSIQQQLSEQLQQVLLIDDTIEQLVKKAAALQQHATELATAISGERHKQIQPFEQKVNRLLLQVGMPNARIKVNIQATTLWEYGLDNIEFLFDANHTNRFEPVKKVASGGELSRLMLCIKSLIAQYIDLPTLIFDEIDTGISGEAAKQVGLIMKNLSENRQIICITHQPQMAGKADAHFFVYKENINNATQTNIRLLNQEERIIAIAQMLGGEKPGAAALETAKEMMQP